MVRGRPRPPGASSKREEARALLRALEQALRHWLFIRLVSMALVGVLVWAGLWLLDIPLAFTLALLAALLDFVPNFGPILAAAPGILLGFLQGPVDALWVALLYGGVQIVEAYGVTPFLQRRALALAPALVLAAQALLGIVVGAVGVALAAPVTLVGVVLVKRLYVDQVLENRRERPAGDGADRRAGAAGSSRGTGGVGDPAPHRD